MKKSYSRKMSLLPLALTLCAAPALAATPAPATLPTGGQVTAGQAAISQSGSVMTINQASDKTILNWQTFNIGSQATVRFDQPSASAVALNRVLAGEASQIYGNLTANGQVYLVNPAGIVFGPDSRVDVGGLVASTLDITDADFLAGKRTFSRNNATGSITNQGEITAADGGLVALLAPTVVNEGVITARLGNVALAAGDRITLAAGADGLLQMAIDPATLQTLIDNRQLIVADGGQVLMTSKAADALSAGVVANSGTIQARTLQEHEGRILLLADMEHGKVNLSGKLDASAPSSPLPLAGEGAGERANGGFVETSAAKVGVGDTARVTTLAANGKAGIWLIDPNDYTIAAAGGDISGAALSANLGLGNVVIESASGGTAGNGDIHVNDAVSWSANGLTLTAARDININAVMTASGSSTLTMNTATANGADAGVAGGAVKVGFVPGNTGFAGRVDFPGRSGTGFLTINGQGYTVVNTPAQLAQIGGDLAGRYALGGDVVITGNWTPLGSLSTPFTGAFNGLGHWVYGNTLFIASGTDLQGLFGYSTGALGNVGIYLDQNGFIFGQNHVGALAGANDTGGIVRNVVVMSDLDTSVYGSGEYVGGLVGTNAGTIVNSHVVAGYLGTVRIHGVGIVGGLVGHNGGAVYDSSARGFALGAYNVPTAGFGGLVGFNDGAIAGSHASGSVVANRAQCVGGLVGGMFLGGASIVNSYATGTVGSAVPDWSTSVVGGLVGYMAPGTSVTNSYSTAAVSGSSAVGGLVGQRFNAFATVTNSFWDTANYATSDGGTGKTSAQMKQAATFAGWDIAATGGSSAVWRIYEGQTAPLLRNFLTPLTVGVNAVKTYDSNAYSGSTGLTYSVAGANTALIDFGSLAYSGTGAGQANAGDYTLTAGGLYTNSQYGYDIGYAAGTLRINPASLTISTSNVTKTYDGTTSAAGSAIVSGGALFGADTISGGSFAFTNRHAGTNKTVTVSGVAVNDGNGGGNYTVSYTANTASTITPANLTVTGGSANNKTYDGTTAATVGGTLAGIIGADAVSLTGAFDTRHVGTGKAVTFGLFGADAGNYSLSATTTANITPASLTLSTNNVSKTYDGTTSAAGTAAVSGGALFGSDTLSGGSFAFADKNAGTNKSVNVSGVTVSDGNGGANYTVSYAANTASNITPASLTVTGGSANNKTYDGTTAATVGGTLSGIIGADAVSLSGVFGTRHVGTGKAVTLGLAGGDAGNYSLSATTTADITPKALTLAGGSANNKTYDGTTAATVGGTLTGIIGGDIMSLSGAFDTRHVGTGKTVTFSLSGADAGNYSLSAATTANITPASLTVTANNVGKFYDGNAYSGGNGVGYAGFVNNETADVLGGLLAYGGNSQGAVNAGSYAIIPSGLTAANYTITFADGILTINPAPLTITANNDGGVLWRTMKEGTTKMKNGLHLFIPQNFIRL